MLEIIWGILNLVLIISFIIISFKAVKLTKQKLGILSAIILTFGLLSFMSSNKNSKYFENKEFDLTNTEKENDKYINTYLSITNIDRNLANSTDLTIKYAKQNDALNLLYAKSNRSGLTMGTKWQPKMISINLEKNNLYNYIVLGQIEWYILGIRLITQEKKYSGKINLE
ncbi:hypothetical protein [Empedobacter stercoris]|uniref:hypothetical protein n=1 Tax=Empedobacter stercoris TaxID=1628248 RepID=UPI0039E9ACA4